MERFGRLYEALETTTSTHAKVAALIDYFAESEAHDAAWAVFFLSGNRLKRLLGGARLREWLNAESDLPSWLVEECYAAVGDLAETISLLIPDKPAAADNLSLEQWMNQRILPLRGLDAEQQKTRVTCWWRTLEKRQCFLLNKMLTGSLRVGVSKILVIRALAELSGIERAVIAHRLTGHWQPTAGFYQALISPDREEQDSTRPYPFFLASPLEKQPQELGDVAAWLAEWKWDGIRAQLIRRNAQTSLWSRGEDLVNEQFPEIIAAAGTIPDGTVLDGEILVWKDGVRPFAELQKRLGRKNLTAMLLEQIPVVFLAYDLLEWNGIDQREQPLLERRRCLSNLLEALPDSFILSQAVSAPSWPALAGQREQARERRVEGLMLKRLSSTYGTGRQKGDWWKWKIDPYTIDAVMIYAQAGHGRRASMFTDYTFAVWRDDQLVPVAKAYSGLSNEEIERLDRWIRRNTIERFGPVRSVTPTHVFELAFEGISYSSRHKSGVALRFPRISRWRSDLAINDADTLEQVQALIDE
jgi:DNA ligase-1